MKSGHRTTEVIHEVNGRSEGSSLRCSYAGSGSRLIAAPVAFVLLLCVVACGITIKATSTASNTTSVPVTEAWTLANQNNYAPSSRTIRPAKVFATSGDVQNADAILNGGDTRLTSRDSEITLDFGYEIAGLVSIAASGASDRHQSVGIAFSESRLYVGPESDSSYGGPFDPAIFVNIPGPGSYAPPGRQLRGGFRYLTIFLASDGWVDLDGVSVHFTASPAMSDLRNYPNYFLSDDDLLNKIWYAGAYTVQLNTIDPHQAHSLPKPSSGWGNDGTISPGTSVLVDGAKRDRNVWPGDLGISQPTAFVSTGDTASARLAIDTLYLEQASNGAFPYCGPNLNCGTVSDTYHLWTLIASADYYRDTRDRAWLDSHWPAYKAGIRFSVGKIDANGLLRVTLLKDWGRIVPLSGENLAPNVLLYRALVLGATLASEENDTATEQQYASKAAALKHNVISVLWDESAGLFRDAPGDGLYAQDGNALALWFGLVDSPSMATRISYALRSNWNAYGALTPERPGAISTFIGSIEVLGHFAANDDQTALDLIRREWGYMLNCRFGTGSTFWEGYLADGSFDYGGSFLSKAHGWASGPTAALSFYVLGIMPTTERAEDYTLIPHPGDLNRVEGRLLLANGLVTAKWNSNRDTFTFSLQIDADAQITGLVGIPTFGHKVRIRADQNIVWDGCAQNPAVSGTPFPASSDGTYVYFDQVRGGHVFESSPSCD